MRGTILRCPNENCDFWTWCGIAQPICPECKEPLIEDKFAAWLTYYDQRYHDKKEDIK